LSDKTTSLTDSIGSFSELVAAGTPTPGGGSVAAYSGVLAAALGRMMCNLTIGKPKYSVVEERVSQIRSGLESLSIRLIQLIAEDAASFEAVLAAYRLPKESDDQKVTRSAEIERATRGAVLVPFETAQKSFQVLRLLSDLAKIGNANAFSDVTVGAELAETAVKGAYYNVAINLKSLDDNTEMLRQIERLVEESGRLTAGIEAAMRGILASE
jgi:formiminotetrahydrofolate cyclodeaminase